MQPTPRPGSLVTTTPSPLRKGLVPPPPPRGDGGRGVLPPDRGLVGPAPSCRSAQTVPETQKGNPTSRGGHPGVGLDRQYGNMVPPPTSASAIGDDPSPPPPQGAHMSPLSGDKCWAGPRPLGKMERLVLGWGDDASLADHPLHFPARLLGGEGCRAHGLKRSPGRGVTPGIQHPTA